MEIRDLEISPAVAGKIIRKHGVHLREVFEVFWNAVHKPRIRRSLHGGEAYVAFGRTEAGRYLVVAFLFKPGSIALVLTAREMTPAERRLYERK